MAEYLNRFMTNRALLACLSVCTIPVFMSVSHAEALVDPTRPPASLFSQKDGKQASDNSGPTLQSIIVGPGRKLAIINGETLKVGDTVGDAKIIKISETEVVLRSGEKVERLHVFPQLGKRNFSHAFASAPTTGGNKGKQ